MTLWLRIRMLGVFCLLGLAMMTASAAPINKDLTGTQRAAVELTSKLDLQLLDESGVIIDRVLGTSAEVYLRPDQFEALRARGFAVQWIRDEAQEFGRELWERTRRTRNPLDDYHTNTEILDMFTAWQATYPDLFHYESIGQSVQGRDLWVAKLSDNVNTDEPEIEVKYVANMHGDEVVGKENCLRFIEELLTGYSTDPELAVLMNEYEMWFLPLMNPDGMELVQRGNANGIDLNRDFPDRCDDSVNTTAGRAIETAHVMNWTAAHNFILSANFHGGALVTNYPWDNNCNGGAVYAPTPEDPLFVWISERYTQYNSRMWASPTFVHGITNGADWYEVSGGMQDWNYVWMGDRELTIELDATKWPAESRLESLWQENRLAMRNLWLEAQYGVRGIVTDSATGDPLRASVRVNTIVYLTYSGAEHGEYFRMLRPGTYSLTFSAPGYDSRTYNNIVVVGTTPTILDVPLQRIPSARIATSPEAISENLDLCDERDVPFTILNQGEMPLTWSALEGYTNVDGDYGSAVGGGWRFISSDAPGGPAYNWVNIAATGTQVSFTGDDQNLGPFPIGFSFPWFGQNVTTFRISANGWISFTSSASDPSSYTNVNLPAAAAPENLLAAWWDDLSPHRTGTNVRRWTNNVDSLVVAFHNVQSYANNGLYNFEMILLSSGKIVLQYANMGTNRLNSSTIGLQNGDRTRGTTVNHNQLYIHNNMALEFCPHSLVEFIPASGTVEAGGLQTVVAHLNSCCLPDGISAGLLAISSNDPTTPLLNITVTVDTAPLPPEAVTDLVLAPEADGLLLTWSASAYATGYLVYRMDSATQDYSTGVQLTPEPITAPTFFDSTAAGLRGFYVVIAVR